MKQSILVIEDDRDIQDLIRYTLSGAGYQVTCVMSAEEGLDQVRSDPPRLIVLDLMLPGMDGLQLCRILRSDSETQDIPVLMVTARAEETDIVSGLGAGADDYLTKPFGTKVLMARVGALLRRRSVQELSKKAPITIRDLQIHPGRYEVVSKGKRVDLSITEFRILLLLAQSPGWVFNRYQIVNEVRGEDIVVADRSVDVHMAGLRKKLGPCGDYIETVRGVGYRFKDFRDFSEWSDDNAMGKS